MPAERAGSCTTTVLLGVRWAPPCGALAQAADAAAVSEPPALPFTVTLNWPTRVVPGARAGSGEPGGRGGLPPGGGPPPPGAGGKAPPRAVWGGGPPAGGGGPGAPPEGASSGPVTSTRGGGGTKTGGAGCGGPPRPRHTL